MSTKVTSVATTADVGSPPLQVRTQKTPPMRGDKIMDQADFRLIIEEDPSGSYVYKTLNRRTGEIVHQFPTETILNLKSDSAYEAGAIIIAKA